MRAAKQLKLNNNTNTNNNSSDAQQMPSHSLSNLLAHNTRATQHKRCTTQEAHDTKRDTTPELSSSTSCTRQLDQRKKSSRTPEVVQYRRHCAGDYEQAQGATGWFQKYGETEKLRVSNLKEQILHLIQARWQRRAEEQRLDGGSRVYIPKFSWHSLRSRDC